MRAAESIAATFRYESRAAGGPTQTLSSAKRTCIASASAVECTATVGMPSSRQARWMRSAISPRLAIRILLNNASGLDDHQRLAILHGAARLDEDLRYPA